MLTHGSWPVEHESDEHLILPQEYQSITDSFEVYYKAQHSGRVLKWLPSMSSVELEMAFDQGRSYTFVLSVVQYIVLKVLHESSGPLDFEALQALTRIDGGQLQSILNSFMDIRLVVDDGFKSFVLASNFTSNQEVVLLSKTCAKDTQSHTTAKVRSERTLDYVPLIQAAFMRYMKRSQETPLSTLQTDVLAELSSRFLPNHGDMEKALGSLVDREFLRRDPKRRDIIHYVP